ncbi:GAF domain-containing protein [Pseudooceanicola nanhaiensis]|nr:GAF domain-containing protein [Pseudooceanicola nanhaiensis]MCA0922249.1 GAF domain-containing protein [Pseudooceanicola nanhaiensis]
MQFGAQTGRHIDRVYETAQSKSAAARSRLAASWRRSLEKHGLDPGERRAPGRVEATSLGDRRAALGDFLQLATPRLDQLFQLVGGSGCGVLLTDAQGVVLETRCREADAPVFREWGLWEGADWSEAAEGTNGIGTCLAERRQVVIHREDHFYARNTAMSCLDAPIHGPDGRLLAALDVSSARADQTEGFNRLIAATVAQTARQIEGDFFRAAFPRARIVAAEGESAEGAALLAVDKDDLVIGATREARRAFGLDAEGRIKPRPASDLLGRDGAETGLDRAERAAIVRALARADGNVSAAARALGMGRATLYRRMNRLGIGEG